MILMLMSQEFLQSHLQAASTIWIASGSFSLGWVLSDVFRTNHWPFLVKLVHWSWLVMGFMVGVTGQQGLLAPPVHLIPPLVYPEVRVCPILKLIICIFYSTYENDDCSLLMLCNYNYYYCAYYYILAFFYMLTRRQSC
jgi:hypothetical protein